MPGTVIKRPTGWKNGLPGYAEVSFSSVTPGKPGGLKGSATGQVITLTWSPAATAGSPITGYIAKCIHGNAKYADELGASAKKATFTVAQSTTFACRVVATSAAGRGTTAGPVKVTVK